MGTRPKELEGGIDQYQKENYIEQSTMNVVADCPPPDSWLEHLASNSGI
jgi:hypothetical protein